MNKQMIRLLSSLSTNCNRNRNRSTMAQGRIPRDSSSCNTYDYSDVAYWDTRYARESNNDNNISLFDWFQKYAALRPFLRHYVSTSSRVLMVGCGNSAMSEDMVKDGYEDIMNIDISSVAVDSMRSKYEQVPQLQYLQMDVRDMGFFHDESFDSVIDKGTLDALMCGSEASVNGAQMLREVSRLLKPGGVYMLITYGDPKSRMPHLRQAAYGWKITLHIIPSPAFQQHASSRSSTESYLEPVPTTEEGFLLPDFSLEDPESHFIYVCKKLEAEHSTSPTHLS